MEIAFIDKNSVKLTVLLAKVISKQIEESVVQICVKYC